jgi:hypothetical protein
VRLIVDAGIPRDGSPRAHAAVDPRARRVQGPGPLRRRERAPHRRRQAARGRRRVLDRARDDPGRARQGHHRGGARADDRDRCRAGHRRQVLVSNDLWGSTRRSSRAS